MILAVFVVLFLIFVVGWFVFHVLWWLISTLVVGLIVGALGRLIVPGAQRIGILATIACGFAGALIGGFIGRGAHLGGFATVLIEIGVAAAAVAVWEGVESRRLPGSRRAIGTR